MKLKNDEYCPSGLRKELDKRLSKCDGFGEAAGEHLKRAVKLLREEPVLPGGVDRSLIELIDRFSEPVPLFLAGPNYNERPSGEISAVVIHYTATNDITGALEIFTDRDRKVSAHYLIGRSGELIQMVREEDRAWHAGVSSFERRENVNDFSLGIELVNLGPIFVRDGGSFDWTGKFYRGDPVKSGNRWWDPYTYGQYGTLISLLRNLMDRYSGITPARIIGHSDVAPERKIDPGEHFDWKLLNDLIGPKLDLHNGE